MCVDWEARQKIQLSSQVPSIIYEISQTHGSQVWWWRILHSRDHGDFPEQFSFQTSFCLFIRKRTAPHSPRRGVGIVPRPEIVVRLWSRARRRTKLPNECCEIKSLSIHCQLDHDSWEMVKVAGAANQIVKLPAVPARDYSNLFCVFDKFSEKSQLLRSNWLPAPVMRTKDPSCPEDPTKHLTLTSENNQENRNNIVLLWLAASATLRKEFEKNKLANIRLRAIPVEKWRKWVIFSDWYS